MAEITMTADERVSVLASIEAGEKVWMIHPDGFTIGIKFEDDPMRHVENRIAAGYALTTPPRQG